MFTKVDIGFQNFPSLLFSRRQRIGECFQGLPVIDHLCRYASSQSSPDSFKE